MVESRNTYHPPSNLLVVGVDGSGKSTFLDQLAEQFDYEVLEPTSTDAARAFKASTLETPVDAEFIDQRESLYMSLNGAFEAVVQERLRRGFKIATTGSKLVTLVSHAVMRSVISADRQDAAADAALRWLDDENNLKPRGIVLAHAPNSTIINRIQHRQDTGDKTEKFWGFNAPTFLLNYQAAWENILALIGQNSAITTLSLDSSELSPQQMLHTFTATMGEVEDE